MKIQLLKTVLSISILVSQGSIAWAGGFTAVQDGANGANGTMASPNGQNGQNGNPLVYEMHLVPRLLGTFHGGHGGNGGNAFPTDTAPSTRGGNGGDGGRALVIGDNPNRFIAGRVLHFGQFFPSRLDISGGNGGNGGTGTTSNNNGGNGGRGGNSWIYLRERYETAITRGGNGGIGSGNGVAGRGGDAEASFQTSLSTTTPTDFHLTVVGGSGGIGLGNAKGGDGGNAQFGLANHQSKYFNAGVGDIRLTVDVRGGDGGMAHSGAGGNGGNAWINLDHFSEIRNPGSAIKPGSRSYYEFNAYGGSGGSSVSNILSADGTAGIFATRSFIVDREAVFVVRVGHQGGATQGFVDGLVFDNRGGSGASNTASVSVNFNHGGQSANLVDKVKILTSGDGDLSVYGKGGDGSVNVARSGSAYVHLNNAVQSTATGGRERLFAVASAGNAPEATPPPGSFLHFIGGDAVVRINQTSSRNQYLAGYSVSGHGREGMGGNATSIVNGRSNSGIVESIAQARTITQPFNFPNSGPAIVGTGNQYAEAIANGKTNQRVFASADAFNLYADSSLIAERVITAGHSVSRATAINRGTGAATSEASSQAAGDKNHLTANNAESVAIASATNGAFANSRANIRGDFAIASALSTTTGRSGIIVSTAVNSNIENDSGFYSTNSTYMESSGATSIHSLNAPAWNTRRQTAIASPNGQEGWAHVVHAPTQNGTSAFLANSPVIANTFKFGNTPSEGVGDVLAIGSTGSGFADPVLNGQLEVVNFFHFGEELIDGSQNDGRLTMAFFNPRFTGSGFSRLDFTLNFFQDSSSNISQTFTSVTDAMDFFNNRIHFLADSFALDLQRFDVQMILSVSQPYGSSFGFDFVLGDVLFPQPYRMEFFSSVPEPSSMLAIGLLLLGATRSRHGRSV